jgi:hypothetical protein
MLRITPRDQRYRCRPEKLGKNAMSNTLRVFDYRLGGVATKPKKDELDILTPHVNIALCRWTKGKDDAPLLTPDLITEGEIDSYIALLKADLDAVSNKAKKALKAATQKAKNSSRGTTNC